MVRAPCCEKMGMKKGPWTPQEDQILINFVQLYGHTNWRALPKQAGLLRCGKSCRLRWINYLRPDIKRGNFSREEEETIINLHHQLGNRWSAIAARLPGRTDNEIKNVWHTNLKKRVKKCPDASIHKYNQEQQVQANLPPSPSHSSTSTDISTLTTSDKYMTNKVDELDEEFPAIDDKFWMEVLSADNSRAVTNDYEGICGGAMPFSSVESVHDMDFWYNVFTRAGELPELPEF